MLGDLSQYDWIIDTFRANCKLMHDLALRLIELIALGLGKPEDYFHGWFKDECTSTWQSVHYSPRDPKKEYKSKLVAREHADASFITLLTTFGYPGLEVEIEGAYRPIKPRRNSLIVNLGETLQMISEKKIKATRHRVVDIGVDRYSSPFFLEPKFSARISRTHL